MTERKCLKENDRKKMNERKCPKKCPKEYVRKRFCWNDSLCAKKLFESLSSQTICPDLHSQIESLSSRVPSYGIRQQFSKSIKNVG
jgi:hypothetical protein